MVHRTDLGHQYVVVAHGPTVLDMRRGATNSSFIRGLGLELLGCVK